MSLCAQNIDKLKHRPSLYIAAFLIIAFILWACLLEIDEHVSGTGRIITSGKARMVQHLEGGIIKDIYVEEGQAVEKGDILFNIINKKAESELKEIEIILQYNLIEKPRLEAEISGDDKLVYDEKIMLKYPLRVRAEKTFFKSRRLEFIEKINGIEERFKQKSLKLDDLKLNVENLKKELDIAKEQSQIKRGLLKAGAISKSTYLEAESTERNFQTRISRVEKEIPVIRAERSEVLNLIEETRQNSKSEIVEDLNFLNLEIEKLSERIVALQDKVNRTSLLSPVRGIIDKLSVNTIGGVVQPGQTLTEITPLDEQLLVEGRISTEDRGNIWLGLPVLAKITAYDYTIYGGISGDIAFISSDSYFDNRDVEYYKILVSLNMDDINPDVKIFPGMTVDLGIITGKTSVMNSILKPIRAIRDNALREK